MKEILTKYWKEIEHYKNNGTLAGRCWATDENDGDSSYTIWYEIDSCKEWTMLDLFLKPKEKLELVIKDSYYHFRKALAEGKTIQHLDLDLEWVTWVPQVGFTLPLKHYRIKPDEPKFKIGDWVRFNGHVVGKVKYTTENDPSWNQSLNYFNYELEGGYKFHSTSALKYELWEPQEGEWCWFWTNKEGEWRNVPILCRFESLTDGWYAVKEFDRLWFQNCEPFIGELPTQLKDNK